jgi:hypothetical protein
VLEPVSVGLKLAFLAVLYLFLLWVARSALKDLRRPVGTGPARPPVDATGVHPVQPGGNAASGAARLVVESVPGHDRGMEYDVEGGATLGRGDVEIHLEDPFASTRHARLVRQGAIVVIEDLGSTNGTYLNGERLTADRRVSDGDIITVGSVNLRFEAS